MGNDYNVDKEEIREAMASSDQDAGVRKLYELLYQAQIVWLNDIINACKLEKEENHTDLITLTSALRDILSITFPKAQTNGEYLIDQLQRDVSRTVTRYRDMTREVMDEAEGQEQQKG